MTASTRAVHAAPFPIAGSVAALAIVLALFVVVGGRLAAVRLGLDPLGVGLVFGAALASVAFAGRTSAIGVRAAFERRSRAIAPTLSGLAVGVAAGIAVGLALAALPIVAASIGGSTHVPGLGRPAAPFVPWALITLIVAAAEEGILRGVLFDRLERIGGLGAAVFLTSVVFALMHVPFYGWHVVPLDLVVGLVLAGLRISTRTLAAPIAAHAVADLATWWL